MTDAVDLLATVRLAEVVSGEPCGVTDPTEDYHEASRMYRGVVDPLVLGAARLERSPTMRATVSRSVKRHSHRPSVVLPPRDLDGARLGTALACRRSRRSFGTGPLDLRQVGALLGAAYGVSGVVEGTPQMLRTAPSGGALYPLELYVVCRRVTGLDPGLYHYDPLAHALETLRPEATDDSLVDLSPYHEQLESSAAVVAITAMFSRSRFKYGARAYRFTLFEAGHVAQNLLLAVAALGLAAVPIGGFFDRDVDAYLGVDGLDEASLYLVPIGSCAE